MAERRGRTRRPPSRRTTPAPPKEEARASTTAPRSAPELVVVARPEAGMRSIRGGVAAAAADVGPLGRLLSGAGARMEPLFGMSEDRLRMRTGAVAAAGAPVPDLSVYYRVDCDPDSMEELAAELRGSEAVEAAYVKPPAEPPQLAGYVNDMVAAEAEPPAHTPDFAPRQPYLDAAPTGIDARHAWTLAGGAGAGVRIVDIEGAWRFSHEDLLQNQGGVIGGLQSTDIRWRNHGTAVVGEFGGDRNPFGVTGICPDANVRAISIFLAGGGANSAAAIRQAADALSPGDIILIELHRPGPRHNFAGRDDQLGYIAVEWWPDDFDAVAYATGRGVIVVEAAGNGAENLDDAIYNNPAPGFPAGWTNPFNRSNRDSGAIVVGAGAPPPGTHGRDHGPDRSRLDFSNYGNLVDAQGWGREVTTCAYGDLQGGGNEDEWYTDRFSGTSSASPIVVGALGSLQGILIARGSAPLTPARARHCLRSTGSPQQDAPGRPATQRIGNRPDIRQLVACATKTLKGEIKEKREKLERKEIKLEKPERKEAKLEIKERKEGKLEIKERKEGKIEKPEIKERKEIREIDFRERFERIGPTGLDPLEERVARLEEAVGELTHFISGELRPDLGQGALAGEADLVEESRRLEKEAADAKQAKDAKDVEKLRET